MGTWSQAELFDSSHVNLSLAHVSMPGYFCLRWQSPLVYISAAPLYDIWICCVLHHLVHRSVTVRRRLGEMQPAWPWWTHLWTSCLVDASAHSSSLRVCGRQPHTVLWAWSCADTHCYICLVSADVLTVAVVFVKVSIEDACDSGTSIGTYSLLLHSYTGRTMLEFQVWYNMKLWPVALQNEFVLIVNHVGLCWKYDIHYLFIQDSTGFCLMVVLLILNIF